MSFPGFTDSETFTRVPDALFRLIQHMDDAREIKATLYLLWRVEHMEGPLLALSLEEMLTDAHLMQGISAADLQIGLEKGIQRGSLLRVESEAGGLFLLNSPRGRAIAAALANGQMDASARFPTQPPRAVPNIFKLYEENIGALTSLMADALRDAEKEYPAAWVHEAFVIAVTRNKRNWKYIEAILKRWKTEGRDERENNQSPESPSGRYAKSQFAEYFDDDGA
jgi:DNA replication protein